MGYFPILTLSFPVHIYMKNSLISVKMGKSPVLRKYGSTELRKYGNTKLYKIKASAVDALKNRRLRFRKKLNRFNNE